MICTFFGHRNTPAITEKLLCELLTELIEHQGADEFYVGNQGNFDTMVRRQLEKLSKAYNINYSVVLAYLPDKNTEPIPCSVYPEGIETVPRKFAITYRNKWMLKKADTVICYVAHPSSGAGQFVVLAEKQGKRILNLNNYRKY